MMVPELLAFLYLARMKRICIILVVLIWGQVAALRAQVQLAGMQVDTSTVIGGIDIPWEMVWGPDDWLYLTERYGRISRVNPQSGQQQVLRMLPDCHAVGESGLLGMALHPDFPDSAYIYYAYTYLQGGQIRERLVRSWYNADAGQLENHQVLINGIPGNSTHNGARLAFLSDKTLLMTTGDAQNTQLPQQTSSLAGKILRLNAWGGIPADNPDISSYVYTLGHRNAQGLVVHPTGKVYISEHGPNTDDELNLILAGRNYGWPLVNGFCDQPSELQPCFALNVVEPLRAWTPTIAPAGMLWYSHSALPALTNKFLLTTLKNERLYVIGLNAEGDSVVSESQLMNGWYGRLRAVCTDPAGNLYLATNGISWSNTQPFTHRIVRISPAGSSVNAAQSLNSLQAYPNPAADGVWVSLSNAATQHSLIELRDIQGRLIRSMELQAERLWLSYEGMAAGWYVLVHPGSGQHIKLLRLPN
jgi:glucose/arabinose dehydrogenase